MPRFENLLSLGRRVGGLRRGKYRGIDYSRMPTRLVFTGSCDHDTFLSACATYSGEWYHSFYFDNGYDMRGSYDIGHDIDGYGFPNDMSGMRVLDVGCGSGWFSFFFEQRGATVIATDTRGYSDFDVYGRADYLRPASARPPDVHDEQGNPLYFSPVSKSMWIMRELLGSKVVYRNARIYDLSPALFDGVTFDLVFVGALLPHLRDPIGALAAVRSVCHGEVIATTPLAPARYQSTNAGDDSPVDGRRQHFVVATEPSVLLQMVRGCRLCGHRHDSDRAADSRSPSTLDRRARPQPDAYPGDRARAGPDRAMGTRPALRRNRQRCRRVRAAWTPSRLRRGRARRLDRECVDRPARSGFAVTIAGLTGTRVIVRVDSVEGAGTKSPTPTRSERIVV